MEWLLRNKGIGIALIILLFWGASLSYLLQWSFTWQSPWLYLGILVQTHLYTGIFITAHDAIHGVVSPDKPKLNYALGWLCASLFAFNNYNKLYAKHHLHHRHVVSDQDPDYFDGPFWRWYLKFALEYVSFGQIVLMGISYNLLKLVFPVANIIAFWELPAILSTLQLFYFGTYQPHKGEHSPDDQHKARSQSKNHVVAFLSCYFFGYHHEHHAFPYLPWWKLAKAKEGK